jgi:hypothetical protein
MGAAKPQSRLAIVLALALARLATATAASADAAATAYPLPEGERLFAYDTALGRFEYVAGRGLRLGKTGFTVGGFATAGGEYLEGGDREAALEGVNLFLFFDPLAFVHVFSEIEIEQLATLERGAHGVRSDPEVEVDRLYLDVGKSDLLNVRFGKFLTPFGRWNQAPAEPLVWTTSEPVIVEEVFDEATTGAALWGTVFRGRGALSYSLYGTFLDPIAPDRARCTTRVGERPTVVARDVLLGVGAFRPRVESSGRPRCALAPARAPGAERRGARGRRIAGERRPVGRLRAGRLRDRPDPLRRRALRAFRSAGHLAGRRFRGPRAHVGAGPLRSREGRLPRRRSP